MSRVDEMAKDLRELHEQATPGAWQKGLTTHHTVSIVNGKEPYRIAEFHHARDAAFCDCAHAVVMELLADRDRLAAEVESLRRDAQRYRWIRIAGDEQVEVVRLWAERELDAAIDTASPEEKP